MANTNEENKLKGKVEEEDMENKNFASSSNAIQPFKWNPNAKPWNPDFNTVNMNLASSSHTNQPFQLNPYAQPWHLEVQGAPEENRSLFMTFSRGFPLSREQIIMYFTRKYGNCLEEVFLHAPYGREPEFGKVVFNSSSTAALVLNNQDVVKVVFGGRSMWLKKYIPRH